MLRFAVRWARLPRGRRFAFLMIALLASSAPAIGQSGSQSTPARFLAHWGRQGILVFVINLSIFVAEGRAQEAPATPLEQYKVLLKEYQYASSSGRVLSDDERMTFVGRTYKHRNALALEVRGTGREIPEGPDRRGRPDPGGLAGEHAPPGRSSLWVRTTRGSGPSRSCERDHIRQRQARPRLSADLLRLLQGVRNVSPRGPGEEPAQGCPGAGLPGSGPFPEQPLAATRPGQRAAGTGQGVRRSLRQGVPRRIAAAGPHQGHRGGRGVLRASRAAIRRREVCPTAKRSLRRPRRNCSRFATWSSARWRRTSKARTRTASGSSSATTAARSCCSTSGVNTD